MSRKSLVFAVLAVILIAFAAGYLLQYGNLQQTREDQAGTQLELQAVRGDLDECRRQSDLARLRDLAGQMYLHVNRNDFNVAAEYSSRFFDHLNRLVEQSSSEALKGDLQEILQERDMITAQLARADLGAQQTIREIYARTFASTQSETR